VKLFLKNKNNIFAKNHGEIQVRTILVCTLYSIKYVLTQVWIAISTNLGKSGLVFSNKIGQYFGKVFKLIFMIPSLS
jgi:hypothetical protein